MIDLTNEQRQELAHPEPTLFDPETKSAYVLVRKEVYDRLKGILGEDREWGTAELRSQLARSSEANGWNEPAMDEYDRYDEIKR